MGMDQSRSCPEGPLLTLYLLQLVGLQALSATLEVLSRFLISGYKH